MILYSYMKTVNVISVMYHVFLVEYCKRHWGSSQWTIPGGQK